MAKAAITCRCGNKEYFYGSDIFSIDRLSIRKNWVFMYGIWYCPECSKKINDVITAANFWNSETLEQAQHTSPWLPIETFVPPEITKINYSLAREIVYDPKWHGIHIADYLYDENKSGYWRSHRGFLIEPTHWMPLPPLPGEQK